MPRPCWAVDAAAVCAMTPSYTGGRAGRGSRPRAGGASQPALRCPPLMRASPSTGREAVARGRSAWPASLAVLAVCATLAALLFLGAWRSPSQRWAGGSGDPVLFLWFIRWGAYAWAHGNSPFITHHMNSPVGVNLMWNTAVPLASLAVAPVTARWGATVAYDLLATAAVALSTWCAYVMISRYVPRRSAALAGALGYGFSPFMLAEGAGLIHLT